MLLEEESQNVLISVGNFLTAKPYRSICLSKWENLERFRYRIEPIKFVNLLVPSSFRHSHIINPTSKLTNFTVTWPLNGSEARGVLVSTTKSDLARLIRYMLYGKEKQFNSLM